MRCVPDSIRDASLRNGLRKNRHDRIGEAFEAVNNGHEDIGNTPGFAFVHDLEPELGPFRLFDPFVGKTVHWTVF